MAGTLKKDYHESRKRRIDYIYRLRRRGREVEKIIRSSFPNPSLLDCLDIGTADGLMLSELNRRLNFNRAVGIDMSEELIKSNKDKTISLEAGNAEKLRFRENSFDVAVAAAVIEHVDSPDRMLSECHRVLKPNGILILTTPNLVHDKIAGKIGYLKSGDHLITFTIPTLSNALKRNRFNVVKSQYFMFWPFFRVPLEDLIESVLRRIGLGKLMSNQLVVGKKS